MGLMTLLADRFSAMSCVVTRGTVQVGMFGGEDLYIFV